MLSERCNLPYNDRCFNIGPCNAVVTVTRVRMPPAARLPQSIPRAFRDTLAGALSLLGSRCAGGRDVLVYCVWPIKQPGKADTTVSGLVPLPLRGKPRPEPPIPSTSVRASPASPGACSGGFDGCSGPFSGSVVAPRCPPGWRQGSCCSAGPSGLARGRAAPPLTDGPRGRGSAGRGPAGELS